MPVPSAITDLSTTAASNSPAGSESPTDGDNYLRAHASFIAQLQSEKAPKASPTFTGTVTADVLTTTGSTTLGNASGDTLTVSGAVTSPKWNLNSSGLVEGDYRAIRTVSAGGNIADTDNFLLVTTTSTVSLPTPVGRTGRVFTVRALVDATIGTAASTIDGASTKSVTANTTCRFVSDGTYWNSF